MNRYICELKYYIRNTFQGMNVCREFIPLLNAAAPALELERVLKLKILTKTASPAISKSGLSQYTQI